LARTGGTSNPGSSRVAMTVRRRFVFHLERNCKSSRSTRGCANAWDSMRRRTQPSSKCRPTRSPIGMGFCFAMAGASSCKSCRKGNTSSLCHRPLQRFTRIGNERRPMPEDSKSSHLSKLVWALIVLGFLLTAAFLIYISRQ